MEKNQRVLTGKVASPGIATAEAYYYEPFVLNIESGYFKAGKETEYWRKYKTALTKTKQELKMLQEQISAGDEKTALIFGAHIAILEDENLQYEIKSAVLNDRMYPELAIEACFGEKIAILQSIEDNTIAERAVDVYDVKRRLICNYFEKKERDLAHIEKDVIVVARDLLPSEVALIDRAHVKGIVLEKGSMNSHIVALVRGYEIPMMIEVEDAMSGIPDGMVLAMDALEGILIAEPTPEEITENDKKEAIFFHKRKEEEKLLNCPCETKDGMRIQIGINIDSSAFDIAESSFDFVGLFRTEFLYMEGEEFLSEKVQFEAYKKVLANAKGHPVILRTLDIGGDKVLSYMDFLKEENPFLGMRGLRLCFEKPEILKTQLRAALRASVFGPLWIMFPMVGSMEDIYRAKDYIHQVQQELDKDGILYDKDIKIGIMIEVPSIALIADMVAEEVDFASIGSNDLTQYLSAADRMNPAVVSYYQNYSPAMVRLLGSILDAFERTEKPVSVCGEMAGNPAAAVLLAGLGAKRISMSPAHIAAVKTALSKISLKEAKALAEQCKYARTEADVRKIMDI